MVINDLMVINVFDLLKLDEQIYYSQEIQCLVKSANSRLINELKNKNFCRILILSSSIF